MKTLKLKVVVAFALWLIYLFGLINPKIVQFKLLMEQIYPYFLSTCLICWPLQLQFYKVYSIYTVQIFFPTPVASHNLEEIS